jgi:hypothetical protein
VHCALCAPHHGCTAAPCFLLSAAAAAAAIKQTRPGRGALADAYRNARAPPLESFLARVRWPMRIETLAHPPLNHAAAKSGAARPLGARAAATWMASGVWLGGNE